MPEEQSMKEVQPQGVGPEVINSGVEQDPAIERFQDQVEQATQTLGSTPSTRRGFLRVAIAAATTGVLAGCGVLEDADSAIATITGEDKRRLAKNLEDVEFELKDVFRSFFKPVVPSPKPDIVKRVGWKREEEPQGEMVLFSPSVREASLEYGYGVKISRKVPGTNEEIVLNRVSIRKGYEEFDRPRIKRRTPRYRGLLLHFSERDAERLRRPYDHKGVQLATPFLYEGVVLDLSSPRPPSLGLDVLEVPLLRELGIEPEQYTAVAVKKRKNMLDAARGIIEEAVELPKDTKWLPELEFNGWQAFGVLPGKNVYVSFRLSNIGGLDSTAVITAVGTDVDYLPDGISGKTFEEAAQKQIETMEKGNIDRQNRGWTPHAATEDLNKIKQELGL